MNDRVRKKVCICLALTAAVFLGEMRSQSSPSTSEPPKPIVVVAEGTKGHTSYTIDSQSVTDLLLSLSRLEEERGAHCPVIALVDVRLPIEEIWAIQGAAGKAQFTNVRIFVFFRDSGKMSEIRQMPAVPFSTHPHT